MVFKMGAIIGRIFSSSRDQVLISASEKTSVNVGDILYVKINGLNRVLLLHVEDVVSKLPTGVSRTLGLIPSGIEPSGSIIETSREETIVAKPLFSLIRGKEVSVTRVTAPPPVNMPVHILSNEDEESRKIMEFFSKGIVFETAETTIPFGVLRSGTASTTMERERKYFETAKITVNIETLIPKHILVSGQTGAGKTTSVMGLIVNWALHASKPIGWLIIDRHGEYGKYSTGLEETFLNKLSKALEVNENEEVESVKIYVYKLSFTLNPSEHPLPKVEVKYAPINVGSLTVDDIAMALDLKDEETVWLEMILETLESIVLSSDLEDSWKNIFSRTKEGNLSGHLLPLLIVTVDNICNYEGVGAKEKKGIYKEFVQQGIYIQKLRLWRNRTASILNLTTKKIPEGRGVIVVLDDSRSIFKISGIFKNKSALKKLLKALVTSPILTAKQSLPNYKWYYVGEEEETVALENGVSIGDIIDKIEEGNIVVLDISTAPTNQADALVLNVVRRLLLNRIGLTPAEIGRRKVVAIVSEEAPLYLTPDKVRSPRNAFARIAREGRKFNIGLVAITQLATIIDKQLLANMNTYVVLRTKFRTDIEYFSSIGVPPHEIPVLNDREGYIYTPDLKVKDPIPAYFKGWFEIKIESEEKTKTLREVCEMLSEV